MLDSAKSSLAFPQSLDRVMGTGIQLIGLVIGR